MKNLKQHLKISLILFIISIVMFLLHYLMFGRLVNTLYYSLMNICFIPVNVLIVTFVFEELIEKHSKVERLSKLNMLIGVFFSDIGFDLLNLIVASDEKLKYLRLDKGL